MFQNMEAKVTRASYFDMCEQLSAEPIYEEIPIEYSDLLVETQQAVDVYYSLPDQYDGMSGMYLGKDLSALGAILDILEIDNTKEVLNMLLYIISINAKTHNDKIKQKQKQKQESKG